MTKDSLLLILIAVANESAFPLIPQTLVLKRLQSDCQVVCTCALVVFTCVLPELNPKLRESNSFTVDGKTT